MFILSIIFIIIFILPIVVFSLDILFKLLAGTVLGDLKR